MKTVLIPLDGSELGEDALAQGLELYSKDEVRIVLVLCMDLSYLYGTPEIAPYGLAELEERDTQENQSYLDEQVARVRERGFECRATLVYGNPIDQILEVADSEVVDQILLTTHGRTGLSRFLLGSVAEGVIRRSLVPVTVIPSLARLEQTRPRRTEQAPAATISEGAPDDKASSFGDKNVRTMTASDVMTREVTVVRPDLPIDELVEVLSLKRISGAPVVDKTGCLVGVVSETDVAQVFSHPNPQRRWADFSRDLWLADLLSEVPMVDVRKRVSDLMNPLTIEVEQSTPLTEVAETMLNLRVHRVIVVDARRHVVGLVSTLDLVRLVSELTLRLG